MSTAWQLNGEGGLRRGGPDYVGVVYGDEVTNTNTGEKETYTGLTEGTMRDRIGKHEGNCRNRHQLGTRLKSHVWKLKDQGSPTPSPD